MERDSTSSKYRWRLRALLSGSCEKTLIERNLKIVVSQRGQNLLCDLSKSGNKLVVIFDYLWLN
jgi:hypothetical protein